MSVLLLYQRVQYLLIKQEQIAIIILAKFKRRKGKGKDAYKPKAQTARAYPLA